MKKTEILILISFAFLCVFAHRIDFFEVFERPAMDYLYQDTNNPSPDIKIIKIDEKTLDAYGRFADWDRQIYANLMKRITTDVDPYFIGFDIYFDNYIRMESDLLFASLCDQHGNVAIANEIVFEDVLVIENGVAIGVDEMGIEEIEQPYSDFIGKADIGFSNTIIDQDGKVRRGISEVYYIDQTYKSFSMIIAENLAELNGVELIDPIVDENNIFNFTYVSQNHEYEEVSFVDVMTGKVDPKIFHNSIVLIGAHATSLQDAYQVPNNSSQLMYGVEIHANIAESIVNNTTTREVDEFEYGIILFYTIILLGIWIHYYELIAGFYTITILNFLYLLVCLFLHDLNINVPVVLFIVATSCMYLGTVLRQYIVEKNSRTKTIKMFKRYVAPQVVEKIISGIDTENDLDAMDKGALKEICVLFVDICGFTTMTEKLNPEQVVDVLNRYFEVSTGVVFSYRGTVDKFIGDAMMAVFNSPFDLEDYEYRAICSAISIRKKLEGISKYAMEKYGVEVKVSIGISWGDAIVGNIGTKSRADYTAVGDVVNVAARLQTNAITDQILITEELMYRIQDRVECESLGTIKVKGKSKTVGVYEVISLK